jgi:hypothetical protein
MQGIHRKERENRKSKQKEKNTLDSYRAFSWKDLGDYFRFADNQGIECLREVRGSYDSPSGELGHTLTIDNR